MKKITCTYGTKCSVSLDTLKGQDVLVLDFNIRNYKVCNSGWHDYKFPSSVAINDKLFLNEEMKIKVVEMLDVFLETGYLDSPDMTRTNRGFGVVEPLDAMGNIISIQESSSASQAKIWLGCATKNQVFIWKDKTLQPYVFERGDVLLQDRLHLNTSKARRLKTVINEVWDSRLIDKKAIKPV